MKTSDLEFIREIASGNLSGAGIALRLKRRPARPRACGVSAEGYATLFATGAGFCLIAAILTWWLVRASDTQPIAKKQRGVSTTLAASTAVAAKAPN